MRSPHRGEVWLVDLGMAAKVRPAVVIGVPADDSDRALVTLVPHTTSPRSSRFEVAVGFRSCARAFRRSKPCNHSTRQAHSRFGTTLECTTWGGRAGRMHVARNSYNEVRGLTARDGAGGGQSAYEPPRLKRDR